MQTRQLGLVSTTSVLILAAALGGETQVAAQTADGPSVGEVVVTAQRRSELQRDVPISMTTISGEQLERAEVRSLTDLSKVTPGLRFNGNGPLQQPTIRGVGTAVGTAGGGSNVGIYIDGFYSPNPIMANIPLSNIENVQVLKGPQGTLFGRNTTGGAIVVTTGKPSQETRGTVEASWGRFNTQRYQAYATTGVTDQLAVDIEGLWMGGDGYHRDIVKKDNKVGQHDTWMARVGVKFDPTENVSFLLRYQHLDLDDPRSFLGNAEVGADGQPITFGRVFPGTVIATKPRDVSVSGPTVVQTKADVLQLTSSFDLGFATLTSYTQYRNERNRSTWVLEPSSASFFRISFPINDKTFSQELLLASQGDSALQWTTGVFLFRYRDNWPNITSSIGGAPYSKFAASGSVTKTAAAFADLTYRLSDRLFLTAGARVSRDQVDQAYFDTANGAGVIVRTQVPGLSSTKVSPRAVIRFKPDDYSSVYASVTRGYKPPILNVGGYSLVGIKVAAEQITAYEVGYKYGRGPLSVEFAAYHYQYKNLQVASYIGTAALVNNAANARINGLEGQVKYDVGNGLEFNVGANYTDAKYKAFKSATGYAPNASGLYDPITVDASGHQMQRTPKFSGNIGARYSTEVAGGTGAISANAYHTSRIFFGADNVYEQPGYTLLNLRVEWTDPNDRYTFAVFGDNVTNKHFRYEVTPNNFGAETVWASPMTWGASIKARF